MSQDKSLSDEMQFSYAIGFIHLLDFISRTQGGDPNQAMMKKVWLTKQAAVIFLKGYTAEEVKALIEQFDKAQVHEKLIAVMQQKVDRDNMMKQLHDSGFSSLDDRLKKLS